MTTLFPSKLVNERITLLFDFLDELEWGEQLTAAEAGISVLTGNDLNAFVVLRLQPVISVDGTQVSQQVRLGVPGVIYEVAMKATGNLGNIYKKTGRLAILPTEGISPLPFGVNLTSTLYPIEVLEGFDATDPSASGGFLFASVVDAFNSNIQILGGVISNGFTGFSTLEGINAVGFIPLNGSISNGFVNFTAPIEGINSSMAPLSGTITVSLIQYQNYIPEGINSTLTPLSGTIV